MFQKTDGNGTFLECITLLYIARGICQPVNMNLIKHLMMKQKSHGTSYSMAYFANGARGRT